MRDDDARNSADGRLGDQGIEFARDLIAGRLALSGTATWIREGLGCNPSPPGSELTVPRITALWNRSAQGGWADRTFTGPAPGLRVRPQEARVRCVPEDVEA